MQALLPAQTTRQANAPSLSINSSAAASQDPQHEGSTAEGGELMRYACISCARRKVKCDKTKPTCSTCSKSRLACKYEVTKPTRAKRKASSGIEERLDRYERLLAKHGILPDDQNVPRASDPPTTPSSTEPRCRPENIDISLSSPAPGPSDATGVESNVWSIIRQGLEPSSRGDPPHLGHVTKTERNEAVPLVSASLFGVAISPEQNLTELYPSQEDAQKLWSIFVRNVDPVIRLVHKPTTSVLVERAAANHDSVTSKAEECLLFAIYHFAVISIDEAEALRVFSITRNALQDRFHSAARSALIGCAFFKTNDLTVLQAFILFLVSAKTRYDASTMWTLSGIAMRCAQRIGMHRDGTELGLKPFETELRRRLWWPLLGHDSTWARLCGASFDIVATQGPCEVKKPLNITDDDIWPDMTEPPTERAGPTEMMFYLTKLEIGDFHRRVMPALGKWVRGGNSDGIMEFGKALEELRNKLEEKFIRHCDITNPIHFLTVAMVRATLNFGHLQVQLAQSKQQLSPTRRKELFMVAIKVLEHEIACHVNSLVARFVWSLQDFFQGGALIWILDEIAKTQQDESDVVYAWEKIEELYECHPELLEQKRPIDVAMGRLTLKAWDISQGHPGMEPNYISSLRKAFGHRDAQLQNTDQSHHASPIVQTRQSLLDFPAQDPMTSDFEALLGSDGALGDMNADTDWLFWEQLMRDTDWSASNF